jgi:hypothetical protein
MHTPKNTIDITRAAAWNSRPYDHNTCGVHHRSPLLSQPVNRRTRLRSTGTCRDSLFGLDTGLDASHVFVMVKQVASVACILWIVRAAVCSREYDLLDERFLYTSGGPAEKRTFDH